MAFDPDKYLAGTPSAPSGGFDPDAYLAAEPQKVGAGDTAKHAKLDSLASPNWFEKQLAKITLPAAAEWGLNRARGFAMGMADPTVGAVQFGANIIGKGDGVNKAISDKERAYQDERKSVGAEGFDAVRMAGNIGSPVNLVAASKLPFATSTIGRVAQGGAMGAAGGAIQPVTDDSRSYSGQKAAQIGMGAVTGAVMAPIMGKLGDALVRRLELVDPKVTGARAAQQTDEILNKALADIGQTMSDLPPNTVSNLRQQVSQALKQGKKLDPAAILRKADFDQAGIPALQGQITRDPMQFARELNLRGVANVGEPISARLSQQNSILQSRIGDLRQGVDEAFNAGDQISRSLAGVDKSLQSRVSSLYDKARNSTGADMDVPLTGLAQDYARILGDFADNVPTAIRGKFAALGLDPAMPSNQKQLFTIKDADALLKVINANDPGFANKPVHTALGELRNAVKQSVMSLDSTGGPFAPAVQAAAQRFKLHEAVPALKAAAEGSVAPDDFVRRFVINGKAKEVQGMAKVLQQADPEAYQQARAQIGAQLYRAAFGEDVVGTKGFAAERFNKALRDLGTEKMGAFFSGDEISKIRQLGRVAAYIHQEPAAAAVNRSNTASAAMNLLGKIPGVPAAVSVGNAAKGAINNATDVRRAMNPSPVVGKADLSPEQSRTLAALLSGGSLTLGELAATPFR